MVNLSDINLNLLISLDALLTECHVTRAADKLDITQAAMSISLKQLRVIFQDALLVRGQKSRMTLTPLAKSLQQPVNQAIDSVQHVFSGQQDFYPNTSERAFHIGMSDYLAFIIMPKLMQYLQSHAPNVQIIQHAVNYIDSLELFERHHLDLILGDFLRAPESLKSQSIFTDDYIIVTANNHPLLKQKRITVDAMMKYPQAFVALTGQPNRGLLYDFLCEQGYKVNAVMFTPNTLIPLQSLPNTLLIAHSVKRLAQPFLKPLSLTMTKAPYRVDFKPKYNAHQYWRIDMQDDPGHVWLRRCIKKICQQDVN